VSLNNRCVSCSGQINFIQKAFKIACLNYKPSRVLLHEVVHSRKDMLYRREKTIKSQSEVLD